MQLIKPNKVILVTGACGQIGTELVKFLRRLHGRGSVIASDIKPESSALISEGQYTFLDVLDKGAVAKTVSTCGVTHIYHLAAVLSASGEEKPRNTWEINMNGLLNILEVARQQQLSQVFWPSSIAVFGPASVQDNCPQEALPEPETVYGISKLAGEHWCRYYRDRYGLDVRSLRYPGLISHSAMAGGGTTDYAVDIFHKAITEQQYHCFLREDTKLPMMYMPDAVRATVELMEAPREKVSQVSAYNIAAMSFTPMELAAEVGSYVPNFKMQYQPDHRQRIADSWPGAIDDRRARQDWGWVPHYNMYMMTMDMMGKLSPRK